jgi:hypothetical protein
MYGAYLLYTWIGKIFLPIMWCHKWQFNPWLFPSPEILYWMHLFPANRKRHNPGQCMMIQTRIVSSFLIR